MTGKGVEGGGPENAQSGEQRDVQTSVVFSMIGAKPYVGFRLRSSEMKRILETERSLGMLPHGKR
jgi:hypothetical protein